MADIKQQDSKSNQSEIDNIPNDVKVPNIKQCQSCGWIIDRYEHLFKCRKCGPFGDLMTGIMERSFKK